MFVYKQFMSKHTFHIQNPLIHTPVSIEHITRANMLNGYEICLNTTNYPICNMQDVRY